MDSIFTLKSTKSLGILAIILRLLVESNNEKT